MCGGKCLLLSLQATTRIACVRPPLPRQRTRAAVKLPLLPTLIHNREKDFVRSIVGLSEDAHEAFGSIGVDGYGDFVYASTIEVFVDAYIGVHAVECSVPSLQVV